jgi:hypothetical protein
MSKILAKTCRLDGRVVQLAVETKTSLATQEIARVRPSNQPAQVGRSLSAGAARGAEAPSILSHWRARHRTRVSI